MTELLPGKLVRRYKRFLADVVLADGRLVTAHCPNTGSMKHCIEADADVWLSVSDNPGRKYPLTWEVLRTKRGDYIGINTTRANTVVEDGIRRGIVKEVSAYPGLQREVRYGEGKYGKKQSRIDFLLPGDARLPDCYVEVKSVTLLEAPASAGVGYFPDAVSVRGAKHIRELMWVRGHGGRAILLFCVRHSGIREVRPADHIDPQYGELLRQAYGQGVEVLAYKARYSCGQFRLWRSLPVRLP